MEYVLKTEGLTKIYSKTRVVDNVDMLIRPGDIYGFVGKNGAGKTTFIRMLLGLARITDGKVSFFDGENIRRARKKTGSLVESPSFYPNMTAEENIRIFCRMIGEDEKQAKSVLEKVGLADTGRKKAGNFSLGMKQRLGLALALVGDPEFLILDEPINGLDPTGIAEIRKLILSLKNEQGKTLLISSHLISELEKIATRYGIIAKGRLVEEITADELDEKCGNKTSLRTSDADRTVEILKKLFDSDKIEKSADGIVYISEKIEDIGRITNELYNNNITVKTISSTDNTIESYFIERMEGG